MSTRNWLTLLTLLAAPIALADGHYAAAADCEVFARNEAQKEGRILGGAARGGAGGALLGRIIGGDSESAERGAALGAIVGGARRAAQRDRAYREAYDRCMADAANRAAEEARRRAEREREAERNESENEE